VVLFVIGWASLLCVAQQLGIELAHLRAFGHSGIGAGAAYIFFAYIGFDAVSTTAQEAKNPQRDLPIGIIASLLICTILYISVAAVLTGMVPWRKSTSRRPSRGLSRSRTDQGFLHHHAGRAGRAHQRDAGDAARADARALLHGQRRPVARQVFRRRPSQIPHPWKNTILVGLLAAIVGSVTPDRRHRQDGQHRNAAGLRDRVCIAVMVLAPDRSRPARPFRTPWVPLVPILGVSSTAI
jgi:basic amino acid/polyamine antiporter, APA family